MIKDITGIVPSEISDEDVYDIFYYFDNEEEAIEYILDNYDLTTLNDILEQFREEEELREEYGREKYLKCAQLYATNKNYHYINELLDGRYVLWEGF